MYSYVLFIEKRKNVYKMRSKHNFQHRYGVGTLVIFKLFTSRTDVTMTSQTSPRHIKVYLFFIISYSINPSNLFLMSLSLTPSINMAKATSFYAVKLANFPLFLLFLFTNISFDKIPTIRVIIYYA